jgi:hypothetical protein
MQNKIILIILLATGAGKLIAQGDETLADKKFRCTATSFTDLVSNTDVPKTSVFIIDVPSETIEWQQKGGSGTHTSHMQITSAVDEWSRSKDTRLLLNIVWEGKAGTIELKKKRGIITLVMDVNPSGKDRLYFIFEVSSLEII